MKSMPKHHQKLKVMVAFGDIRGFSSFFETVTDQEEELIPFLNEYDDIIQRHVGRYNFKDTGDGFMCLVDMNHGHNCRLAISLLKSLWGAYIETTRLIRNKNFPYPDGYRITATAGPTLRKMKEDGSIVDRGKHINLAHKMLRFQPITGILLHESFKQLISSRQAKANGLLFKKIRPQKTPEGISGKDAMAMWEFRMARARSGGKS